MSSLLQREALRPALTDLVLREIGATGIVRACARCGSASHGRPRLVGVSGLWVSLSYAEGLAVAAWSPFPVGIDVERSGPGMADWTRTEAVLKATGAGLDGLSDPLPPLWTVRLDLPDGWEGAVALDLPQEGLPTFECRVLMSIATTTSCEPRTVGKLSRKLC